MIKSITGDNTITIDNSIREDITIANDKQISKYKKIVILDASPKSVNITSASSESSVSRWLSDYCKEYWKESKVQIEQISVRKSMKNDNISEDYSIINKADALIIIFPLYFFCLPGMLTRYLQDYLYYASKSEDKKVNTKVYTIVNCGFPEPEINDEAIRVIKSFSQKTGNQFRFGIALGAGPMICDAKDAPFMKKVFKKLNEAFTMIEKDIQKTNVNDKSDMLENVYLKANFPRKLYLTFGGRGWIKVAKGNKLTKKAMFKRPYTEID